MTPHRMRFAAQAHAQLLADDPGSAVTLNYVRQLAASGAVRTKAVGKSRRLIDYDDLLAYLASDEAEQERQDYGTIRPVAM